MSRKDVSGILLALLALSMSMLVFNVAVKQAKAAPDPWEMPVVYIQSTTPAAGVLRIDFAVYNLSDHFYPTDEEWHPGEPLGPYASGPVARYNYTFGNLYAFDISISWNPAVLSYTSHVKRVPVQTNPGGILNTPVLLATDDVDPVAGTYRIGYTSNYPADPFNAEEESARVFSMLFSVLNAGDKELSIDSVSLIPDRVSFPEFQPVIPWRAVLSKPHITGHNVGIEAALVNKKNVGGPGTPPPPVGFGFHAYVVVINSGDSAETFDLTIYAGASVVGTGPVSISASSSLMVTVSCSTAGLAKGSYSVKAVASAVSGETYLDDNELPFGSIFVTLAGDVDGSKAVNIFDIVKMAGVYGIKNTNIKYDPYCDLDNDGDTDIFDIVTAAGNYGKSWI